MAKINKKKRLETHMQVFLCMDAEKYTKILLLDYAQKGQAKKNLNELGKDFFLCNIISSFVIPLLHMILFKWLWCVLVIYVGLDK